MRSRLVRSRRNFLKIGAFGLGLSLPDMLRGQAATPAPISKPAKSAIMIYLLGGPPHIDMYDLKLEAPVEYRGEFQPIQTNVPGVSICELFPRQAQISGSYDQTILVWDVLGTESRGRPLPPDLQPERPSR